MYATNKMYTYNPTKPHQQLSDINTVYVSKQTQTPSDGEVTGASQLLHSNERENSMSAPCILSYTLSTHTHSNKVLMFDKIK